MRMANEERHPPPWQDQALLDPTSVFASPEALAEQGRCLGELGRTGLT